jgi:Flp pilus assembly protein TadB
VNRRATLRASDADREGIVERLHKAATEGRIAAEELEERVARALKARTYADLDRTVADLPAPRSRRQPSRRGVPAWALSTVRTYPMLLVFVIPVLAVTIAMILAATIIWCVLTIVILMLGGRSRMVRPPWIHYGYTRRLPRRGPGGFSA